MGNFSKQSESKTRSLNDSIAILLRSYTRAINKQEERSGALFRSRTKAECLTKIEQISPSFYNSISGTNINNIDPASQHPENCFHYIHQNPVKANLVKKATDWEFSSARHYAKLCEDKLTNRAVAKQYIINLTEA